MTQRLGCSCPAFTRAAARYPDDPPQQPLPLPTDSSTRRDQPPAFLLQENRP